MRGSWFALLLSAFAPGASAAPPVDFNRDVRPILSNQCYTCHGPDEKARKADLRLDRRDDAIAMKALVPGKPDESELIARILSDDPQTVMPPSRAKKPPLTPAQIAVLKRWIAEGATFSDHWSFAKLSRPEVPKPTDPRGIKSPIDAFLRYRLEQENVSPAKPADKVTLIRRVSFDLTGLPPTVTDVDAFVKDESPQAFEAVVDRLLASPHFGERMAVWWLDLVRYADSIGYHSDNPMNVHPYREYVIRSFNANKRFDQFTKEQLAGDLMPNPTTEQKVATAYNRLLQTTEEGGAQAKEYEVKYAADRVRNYAQVWLGATLMCAECHDHKFDPYTQKDFYSMAAFFADVQEPIVGRREPGMMLATAEQDKELKRLSDLEAAEVAKLTTAAKALVAKPEAFTDVEKWGATVPKPVKDILATAADKRTDKQNCTLLYFAKDHAPSLKPERETARTATNKRTAFEDGIPRTLVTTAGKPRTVRILARGNWQDESGPVVSANTPSFLPPLPPRNRRDGGPTRADLADWTVSTANPLTARVLANRLWKLFFGHGLSRSLEESGSQGEPPTHPELLDWLATEVRTDWDVKRFIRLLVVSSAYQQSSVETPAVRERDPLNKLFARQSRYRLDAEFVRDTALSVSGLLVNDVGGPSVKPYQPAGYWSALNFPVREWETDSGTKKYRRGLYTHWQRSFPHPSMIAFDAPSREECTCERPRSNIPQQALALLNDPSYVEAATAFAKSVLEAPSADDAGKVRLAFRRATGREPSAEEAKVLGDLLAKHKISGKKDTELAAWTSVCRVILNLHETITRQ